MLWEPRLKSIWEMQNKPEILQAPVWILQHCSIPALIPEDQLTFRRL